jgi:hypothetical protein
MVAMAVGTALAVAAPAAGADATADHATGKRVDIALTWYWDGVRWVQRFRAIGGLAAQGAYAGDGVLDGGTGRTVLRTPRGRIVVAWTQVQRDTDPFDWTIQVAGRWRVVSTTGVYTGLTGGGWFRQDVDVVESGLGELVWHGRVTG